MATATSCGVVLRPRICRTCDMLFWICRHCDRGHCYCSTSCRYQGYRQKRRLANRRHQQSPEGRLDHRDRQRALRRRRLITQKSVTDQSSLPSAASYRMPLAVAFRWPSCLESPWPSSFGWLAASFAADEGSSLMPSVKTGGTEMPKSRPQPPRPDRRRLIRGSFSWIDHRFLREGFPCLPPTRRCTTNKSKPMAVHGEDETHVEKLCPTAWSRAACRA
jgi:hypothetical protein